MTVVGICSQMCPDEEIQMRSRTKRLSYFEIKGDRLCVKEYARCAAGSVRKPGELRTPSALQKTTNHLISLLDIKQHGRTWIETTNFVTDRFRAVRQDIIIQQLPFEVAVPIIEKIIRYHILIRYLLYRQPIQEHDPVLNNQLLRSYLGDLLEYYNIAKQSNLLDTARCDEFKAYEILLLVKDASQACIRMLEAAKEGAKLDLNSPKTRFEIACCTCKSLQLRNYKRFFKMFEKMTFLESCCLLYQISDVRASFLSVLSYGYCSKQLKFSIERLANWLHFDEIEHLKTFLDIFQVSYTGNVSVCFHEKKQYTLKSEQERYGLARQCTYFGLIENKIVGYFDPVKLVIGDF